MMLTEADLAVRMAESARNTMAAFNAREMLDFRRTNPVPGGGRPARRQDAILAVMKTAPDKSWTARDVATAMRAWDEDNIRKVMDRIEATGAIVLVSSAGARGRGQAKVWRVA